VKFDFAAVAAAAVRVESRGSAASAAAPIVSAAPVAAAATVR